MQIKSTAYITIRESVKIYDTNKHKNLKFNQVMTARLNKLIGFIDKSQLNAGYLLIFCAKILNELNFT
jgi:hypothetical protein